MIGANSDISSSFIERNKEKYIIYNTSRKKDAGYLYLDLENIDSFTSLDLIKDRIDLVLLSSFHPNKIDFLIAEEQHIVSCMNTFMTNMIILTKRIIPLMNRNSHFFFLSSTLAHQVTPSSAIYSAQKAGLEIFFKSLAMNYDKLGICFVNLVLGLVDTKMNSDKNLIEFCNAIPVGRVASPTEIADVIQSLTITSYINGSSLYIDGGLTLGSQK